MQKYSDRDHRSIYGLIAAVFAAALVAFLYFSAADSRMSANRSDFIAHAKVAQHILEGGKMPPHFLHQAILIGLNKVFHLSFLDATLISVFIIVFLSFLIVYNSFRCERLKKYQFITLGIVCFVLISHPIPLLFSYDSHLYNGYIASNVYHNPSILLLKPIAVLHFWLLTKTAVETRVRVTDTVALSILTVLSIFAKPNFIIALVPALFLLIAVRCRVFGDQLSKWLKIFLPGVLLPSIIVLTGQFLYFYGGGEGNSIHLHPFAVFLINSDFWTLVPKLVCSIAFPLATLVMFPRILRTSLEVQLSALMLIVSLLYSYLLVDVVGNKSVSAGNFWWSAQISTFLFLLATSKAYLLELFEHKKCGNILPQKAALYIPISFAVIHFTSGVFWYASNVIPQLWRP